MKLNRKVVIAVVVGGVVLAGAGFAYWKQQQAGALPAGIVSTNGRVEATRVDIATKIAGRVIEIVPDEGDMVPEGSVVARLDSTEIEAQLRQSEAEAQRARNALATAEAVVTSRRAELTFADQQMQRSAALVEQGFTPRERFDERKQLLDSAEAALDSALAQVDEAHSAIAAADAQVDRLRTLLDDATITSPIRGRVQYRLIEPGAVLAAGGRIATILDLTDVYMTAFLPTAEAGRLVIGDEARVVIDAVPDAVFPVTVSFVAPEAQFTPKSVETETEREQLMFRVKLQAPPELLEGIEERVNAGIRGIAYIRTDPQAEWPARLDVKLPDE